MKHILEALDHLSKWTFGLELKEFKQDQKIKSACLYELHTLTSHALKLTENTFLELSDFNQTERIYFSRKAEPILLIRGITESYYGADDTVLWDIMANKLPGFKEKSTTLYGQWDDRFKMRLAEYYIAYLYIRSKVITTDRLMSRTVSLN